MNPGVPDSTALLGGLDSWRGVCTVEFAKTRGREAFIKLISFTVKTFELL